MLYNGTTGLLQIIVTIDGKSYEVASTTVWFDRQWVNEFSTEDISWVWIGTPLNETNGSTAAISLWDLFEDGTRRSFATILDENGLQYNVLAEVSYERIWTSERTGNSYPREVHVDVPSAELTMSFTAMLDKPEFLHGGQTFGGTCQSLGTMTGSYRGAPINSDVIIEMVGDVAG